jgi:hypothetical protein
VFATQREAQPFRGTEIVQSKKKVKMVHVEDPMNVDSQESIRNPDSGSGFPLRPVLHCDHNPPAELDPYIYVVLTSL